MFLFILALLFLLECDQFVSRSDRFSTPYFMQRKKMAEDNKSKTAFDILLDNFQLNFGQLSDSCLHKLKHHKEELWSRYCFDFLICNFVVAPSVISFWRGTWDHSLIYLEQRLFDVCKKTWHLASFLKCPLSKVIDKACIFRNKILQR